MTFCENGRCEAHQRETNIVPLIKQHIVDLKKCLFPGISGKLKLNMVLFERNNTVTFHQCGIKLGDVSGGDDPQTMATLSALPKCSI
jgi:hypothetical protein